MKQILGKNSSSMKEDNIALILQLIHHTNGISRLGISKITGLTGAAVTKIIRSLIEINLVNEIPMATSFRGRPEIGLVLNSQKYVTIGIRINRRYVHISSCDLYGHLLYEEKKLIGTSMNATQAFDLIKQLLSDCLLRFNDRAILGIGIAVPGPFIYTKQKILLMSGFEGWNSINIKNDLESIFSIPVYIEHDAVCGALNEYYYENTPKTDTLVFIAVDRGVGAGVLIDGKPYHGALGSAGEFGHASIDYNGEKCVCGNKGCLELYCSSDILIKKCDGRNIDDILNAVINKETAAVKAYNDISYYLGIGIVNFINTFNPKTIVVSDKIAIPEKQLYKNLNTVLKERLLPEIYHETTLIVKAPSKDLMLSGTHALVLEVLFSQPQKLIKGIRHHVENFSKRF